MIYRKEKSITPADMLYDYKMLYVNKFKQALLLEPDTPKKQYVEDLVFLKVPHKMLDFILKDSMETD